MQWSHDMAIDVLNSFDLFVNMPFMRSLIGRFHMNDNEVFIRSRQSLDRCSTFRRGIACVGLAFWLERQFPKSSFRLLAVGIGLFVSDMIHHFVVLWIITGNPQFDLLY